MRCPERSTRHSVSSTSSGPMRPLPTAFFAQSRLLITRAFWIGVAGTPVSWRTSLFGSVRGQDHGTREQYYF